MPTPAWLDSVSFSLAPGGSDIRVTPALDAVAVAQLPNGSYEAKFPINATSPGMTNAGVPEVTVALTLSRPNWVTGVSFEGVEAHVTASFTHLAPGGYGAEVPLNSSQDGMTNSGVRLTLAAIVLPADGATDYPSTFQWTVQPKDVNGNTVPRLFPTFASDNPAVAVVDASGLVTGLAPGTATIRASCRGFTKTLAVTVVAPE